MAEDYYGRCALKTGEAAAAIIRLREAYGPAQAARQARVCADVLIDLARDLERAAAKESGS